MFPSILSEVMFNDYNLELLKKIIDTPNNGQVILAIFLLVSKDTVVLANMNLIRNYDSP